MLLRRFACMDKLNWGSDIACLEPVSADVEHMVVIGQVFLCHV